MPRTRCTVPAGSSARAQATLEREGARDRLDVGSGDADDRERAAGRSQQAHLQVAVLALPAVTDAGGSGEHEHRDVAPLVAVVHVRRDAIGERAVAHADQQ